MGNDDNFTFEVPVHTVKFSYDFMMDSTEITQLEYATRMAAVYNSSEYSFPMWDSGSGDNYPVYNVNWYDAVLYCNARTKQSGSTDTVYSYTDVAGVPGNGCTVIDLKIDLTKHGFRLPTEAEWEYACRAGSTTDYYWGKDYDSLLYPISEADSNQIDSLIVWFRNSFEKGPEHPDYGAHQVAQKPPNAFNLYDIIGNVWEWCNDWHNYEYYGNSPIEEPTGSATGAFRVIRGGCWRKIACPFAWYFCSSTRCGISPERQLVATGFRIVLPL
jgi:formylglycine-generating enzyme required for sulfatase activity